jgi:tripartite-type tricarboxylate transporter receptor subunit TctC
MFNRRSFLQLTAISTLATGFAGKSALAQTWPSRPVTFVVGFAAGGPNDIVARIMGAWLAEYLDVPFVIEDRTGAGGMLAAQTVINSPPDGYTIMFVAPNNAIGATLYKNLPFVYLRDTTPIAGMLRLTNVMVVPPSLPVKSVAEFIEYAKVNPGKINYASSGNGTSVHMSAELFKMMTKLDASGGPASHTDTDCSGQAMRKRRQWSELKDRAITWFQ